MTVDRRQLLQIAGLGALGVSRKPQRHTYAQAITATGVGMARPALAAHFNPTGGGAITHGKQITTANTGYGAYFDPGLGRNLTLGDLTVVSGTHFLTDFTAGGTGGTRR